MAQTSLYVLVCYTGALRNTADRLRMSLFHLSSCVCGYHVYKDVWAVSAGAVLQCEREGGNSKDPDTVAVQKDDLTVGHVLCTISCIFPIFV